MRAFKTKDSNQVPASLGLFAGIFSNLALSPASLATVIISPRFAYLGEHQGQIREHHIQ